MSESNNSKSWWKRLIGTEPELTKGELKLATNGAGSWKKAQDLTDARRLIASGKKTKDEEMVKVGQLRLRVALGKQTPEDEELLT